MDWGMLLHMYQCDVMSANYNQSLTAGGAPLSTS